MIFADAKDAAKPGEAHSMDIDAQPIPEELEAAHGSVGSKHGMQSSKRRLKSSKRTSNSATRALFGFIG
jgi:hypothetical protein